MHKNTILLTGSSGFIGKNIHELLSTDYVILAPKHNELNLTNEHQVHQYFNKNTIDIVINCAFIGSNRGESCPHDMVEQNIRMFLNIVRAGKNARKIIHICSGAAYGKQKPLVKVKETDIGKRIPEDGYGLSKYICAKLAKEYSNIVVLRPFGVFGKYEEASTRFITYAILKAQNNQQIIIKRNVIFDYLYVNDFVAIIDHFIVNDNQHKVYNCGSGLPIDLVTLARMICKITGSKSSFTITNQGFDNEYTCDVSRLAAEIEIPSFTSHEKAIADLAKVIH